MQPQDKTHVLTKQIKIWEQMNASLVNEYSILAILMKA